MTGLPAPHREHRVAVLSRGSLQAEHVTVVISAIYPACMGSGARRLPIGVFTMALVVTGAPRALLAAVWRAVQGRLPAVPPGANPGGGEGDESRHAQDRARDPGALTACHGPDDADEEDHCPD
jgi:hypothetical protein